MRSRLLPLLLAVVAAAENPPSAPEVTLPDGDEWETAKPDRRGVAALYRTEFADSDPKAIAEVRVMIYPLSAAHEKKELEAIASDWAALVESELPEGRLVKEEASKLGDADAWKRDLKNDWARLTWYLARKGKHLYVFHVIRTYRAVEDERVEEQVTAMRASFRFPAEAEPEAEGAGGTEEGRPPEPPPVEEEKRESLKFAHWRLECVKPEGLHSVPPQEFDRYETDSGVIARFEARGDQAVIMIRIYARSKASQRFSIDQLAEQKLTRFEQKYDDAHRQEPRRDEKIDLPMAKRVIFLELKGRKRTIETTRWYLAQCQNDRQYEIEIYVASGDPDRWAEEIRDLIAGFRPVRG